MMTSSNKTFSALLALCTGNSPVTGEFHAQRPVTRNFDVFIDLRLNKRLSKQSWGWWFETPPGSLWRHCNVAHGMTLLQYYYTIRNWITIARNFHRIWVVKEKKSLAKWTPKQIWWHFFSNAFCWVFVLCFKFHSICYCAGPVDVKSTVY